jgi:hypothetical protein
MDVVTALHPRGSAGLEKTLELLRQGAVKDGADPKVREFAFQVLQEGGNPQDPERKAQLLLAALLKRFHYISDPVDVEFIASTRMTLCLDEAELCYRGGDCDDAARAMAALLLIVGVEAVIVYQEFHDTDHVLVGFDAGKGRWMRVDPCYFDVVGAHHRHFLREKWIDVMTGHVMCSGKDCPMGLQEPGENVILKARPLGAYVGVSGVSGLGATSDPVEQVVASWGIWLDGADKDMVAARDSMMASHDRMVATRAGLGLPAVDPLPPGEGGAGQPLPPGLWTQQMENSYQAIVGWAATAHQYAQEALQGTRKAHWVVDQNGNGQIGLEQMPGDKVQLQSGYVNGRVTVQAVDIATGQVLGSGQASAGPLLVIGGIVAAVVVLGGTYLIVRQICQAVEAREKSVAQRNLTDKTTEWVQSGAATPAEAKAFVDAIGKATPTTPSSEAQQPQSFSGNLVDFAKILVIGGVVVVSLGGIIYLIKTYGPAPKHRTAAAAGF